MSVGRDSMYNLVGSFTPLVLALVTIPLYLSAIGPERYGALAIAWLILGYFGLFDLGLGRATAQRIASLHKSNSLHRARVFWTAAAVNVALGVVGAGLLYVGANYFFEFQFEAEPALIAEALAAVPLLALAVPIATLTGVASGALQGRKKFLDVNACTVASACLFQLLPLAIAHLVGPELLWLIAAAIVARALGLMVFLSRVYVHLLRGELIRFDQAEWLTLLKFGGWVALVSAISPLLVVIDRFFIGALISAIAVTVYTIPFEIVQRISILPRSIAMALFPRMAESDLSEGAVLADRAILVVNVIVTPAILALCFVIQPFLTLWIGPDLAQRAGPIALVLLLGYWTNAFGIIPYSRLQAMGKPELVAWTLLGQLPFYVAAMYFCILYFGLVGAAVVFSLRTTIDFLILHRLSSGGWSISPWILVSGILVGVAILANNYFEPLSVWWWTIGLIEACIFIFILVRRVPEELEEFTQRFLPSFVGRHLRYV